MTLINVEKKYTFKSSEDWETQNSMLRPKRIFILKLKSPLKNKQNNKE